jgi:hypothetical protein
LHVEVRERVADAADQFARAELFAQLHERAILKSSDGTEEVFPESSIPMFVIGVGSSTARGMGKC